MATAIQPAHNGPAIAIPWWSWLVMTAALFGAYVMLQENGLVTSQWMTIHELFHDSRHALGFPCH